jgi:hypothetical protein
MSLEAHRGSLSLVLELVSVSLSKAIRDDVAVVRTDVHDIKQDTGHIPEIMAELARLRAIVDDGEIPTTTRGQNFVLEQYLDSLTSYAETVCNDVVWDSDRSLHTSSRRSSIEHAGGSSSHTQRARTTVPLGQIDGEDDPSHQVPTAQVPFPAATAGYTADAFLSSEASESFLRLHRETMAGLEVAPTVLTKNTTEARSATADGPGASLETKTPEANPTKLDIIAEMSGLADLKGEYLAPLTEAEAVKIRQARREELRKLRKQQAMVLAEAGAAVRDISVASATTATKKQNRLKSFWESLRDAQI